MDPKRHDNAHPRAARPGVSRLLVLLLSAPLVRPVVAQGAAVQGGKTASIKNDPAYGTLKNCGAICLWHSGSVDDLMAQGLNCAAPWNNDCLCQTEKAGVATSFLSYCASVRCTTAVPASEASSAISVYYAYCESNGFGVVSAAAAGAGLGGGGGSQTTTGATTGRTGAATTPATGQQLTSSGARPTGTSTPSSSAASNSGGSSGLSLPALIGIIVSVACSVLGLIFGIGFKVYKYKKQKRIQAEMEARQPSQPGPMAYGHGNASHTLTTGYYQQPGHPGGSKPNFHVQTSGYPYQQHVRY